MVVGSAASAWRWLLNVVGAVVSLVVVGADVVDELLVVL